MRPSGPYWGPFRRPMKRVRVLMAQGISIPTSLQVSSQILYNWPETLENELGVVKIFSMRRCLGISPMGPNPSEQVLDLFDRADGIEPGHA